MPTHVALLRAINVGGGGKIPMADLRKLVTSLGHAEVSTYIQTGNIVLTPSHDDAAALAAELESAIAESFGVRTALAVLSRAELADVIAANPYPDEPNPRYVHGVFLMSDPDDALRAQVAEAVAQGAAKGSKDEATVIGRTVYLHTPNGFGTSDLARSLLTKRSKVAAAGTARNWATITKLLALCDA
jgi:uncharacterized protein (DUF1697 family)